MARLFYVYIHCRPDGSPFYVGKGCGSRAYNLSPEYRRANSHHKNIVAKYGAPNIKVEIIECSSEEQAFQWERHLIHILRYFRLPITNLTDGGEGPSGLKHSEVTKRKMALSNTGKKCSFETRLVLSEKAIGRRHSAATIEKMRLRRPSEETRRLMSLAAKNRPNPMLGRKHSEETKRKISETKCRKVSNAPLVINTPK